MATPRRRKMIGRRRRIEDEGEDDVPRDGLEMDDDSLTEGSLATDDHDYADDSDTSNIDEASPTSPNTRKSTNGKVKSATAVQVAPVPAKENKAILDTDMMLHGLADANHENHPQEINFDDVNIPSSKPSPGPTIVSSAASTRAPVPTLADRKRQEHEDYRRKRDEDPAFVPNRGSFFMHDHRHAGPAANGFRPFGRGRGRGGGRGGFGEPFVPFAYVIPVKFPLSIIADNCSQMRHPGDPTTSSPWTHDMHETVTEPTSRRSRPIHGSEAAPFGDGPIPRCTTSDEPINRTMSTEKHIGNVQVRVYLPDMASAITASGMPVKQYTRLPDHRPPLRSDKPVRISLPQHSPRYIYPAEDRSFTFIPRALRPNQQQRVRGKPRSGMGSMGGYSRKTSVYGGSYYGSVYSPSVAMSRRSSIHERDFMFSPAGSVMSRPPPPPPDAGRPIVKLPPPPSRAEMPALPQPGPIDHGPPPPPLAVLSPIQANTIPHIHGLPPKPPMQEFRPPPSNPTLHQPRPQKNISVADIELPAMSQGAGSQAFHGAFHHQVPPHVSNGYPSSHSSHSRQGSFYQQSTGTPLSQIPERAIHAAPFHPNSYGQQQQQQPYYGQQAYQAHPPQNFGYGQTYMGSNPGQYVPSQQGMPPPEPTVHGGSSTPASNLVAQQVNGMVYYYDASQMAPVNPYQQYPNSHGYQPGAVTMNNMGPQTADPYYYGQPGSGMVYYQQ